MANDNKKMKLQIMANSIVNNIVALLMKYEDRTADEVQELGKRIPFRVLKDITLFAKWADDNQVSFHDGLCLLLWAGQMKEFLAGVDPVDDVSYDEVLKAAELAQKQSIILHRVNFLLHEQMLVVYDILENEKKNRLRFMAKKHYLEAEKIWEAYDSPRQKSIELTAWSTLQTHLVLVSAALQPRLQRVYEAARDRMIYLGVKDVELRSRIVVALTVGKVQHHTFNHLFDDFKREHHCDLRRLYADDDLTSMTKEFADMAKALGFPVTTDKYGLPSLQDFDIDSSVRTGWAWKSFMNDLRDEDLMDETAKHAIELNPKIRENYYTLLKEEEERMKQAEQKEMVDRLTEKYNVTKL